MKRVNKGVEQEIVLKGDEQLINIELKKLTPNPNQPRKTFDDDSIEELANSIKQSKQLVPIIVSPLQNGKYLIVDGERRFRAAKKFLKFDTMPAIMKPMTDEEIEVNSLVVNVNRQDIPQAEKEDYVHRLHERFGDARTVAKKIGWKSHVTVLKHLQAWEDRHGVLVTRVTKDILDDTSMTVLDLTKKIENPDKRAKFIEMIQTKPSLPWDLRRNKEALGKAVTIFNQSKPPIQDKILADELTFDDAKRLSDTINKGESKLLRPLSEKEVKHATDIFTEQLNEERKLERNDDAAIIPIITGEEVPQKEESETEKIYTLEDKFSELIKVRRNVVIAHDIHFESQYDDADHFAGIQKKMMEVLSYVGSESNISESSRMKMLEEFSEYNKLVYKLAGMVQPIVDAEIKNSKKIDLENLR